MQFNMCYISSSAFVFKSNVFRITLNQYAGTQTHYSIFLIHLKKSNIFRWIFQNYIWKTNIYFKA